MAKAICTECGREWETRKPPAKIERPRCRECNADMDDIRFETESTAKSIFERDIFDRAPTPVHRAIIELTIAAVAARQSAVSESHNPWFLLAGPTMTWKTWTARFCSHLLGLDPNHTIVMMSNQTGRSIFKRKNAEGETVTKNPLLNRPLAVLDEVHEIDADSRPMRDARSYLQGERTLLDEGEELVIEPVTMATLNFHPDDPGQGPLDERTAFDEAQLRRAVPADFTHVDIPRSEWDRGNEYLEEARHADDIPIRDVELLGRGDEIGALIQDCVSDASGPVDLEMLDVIASGMQAYVEDADAAVRRTVKNYLTCVSTLGWTVEGWEDAFTGGPSGDESALPGTAGAGPDLSAAGETSLSTATESQILQALREGRKPADIVADGVADYDAVEQALDRLETLEDWIVLQRSEYKALRRRIRRQAREEADVTVPNYPCAECGEPIPLLKPEAQRAMYETLRQASRTPEPPNWRWRHEECPTDDSSPYQQDHRHRRDSARDMASQPSGYGGAGIQADDKTADPFDPFQATQGDERGEGLGQPREGVLERLKDATEAETIDEALEALSELGELRERREQMEMAVERERARRREIQAELEELQAELALTEEAVELQAYRDELQEEVAELEDRVADLKEQEQEVREVAPEDWELAELAGRLTEVDDIEQEIAELEDERDEVEVELQFMRQEVADLRQEFAQMEGRQRVEIVKSLLTGLLSAGERQYIGKDLLSSAIEEQTQRFQQIGNAAKQMRHGHQATEQADESEPRGIERDPDDTEGEDDDDDPEDFGDLFDGGNNPFS